MTVNLIETKDWETVRPLCIALEPELGPGITKSMRCWCGLDERPYPLTNWNVRFGQVDEKLIGVTGSYQEPNEACDIGWIGWIGVVPEMQRRGIGTSLITFAENCLKAVGVSEVRVHTSSDNAKGIGFYEALGYSKWGNFSNTGLVQRSASDDSVVLSKAI